jgi:hypothetical protein
MATVNAREKKSRVQNGVRAAILLIHQPWQVAESLQKRSLSLSLCSLIKFAYYINSAESVRESGFPLCRDRKATLDC